MPKLSVLARAVVWNTNERDVCTSREFWQLILLVLDGIFFLPKLKEKLDLKIKVCPCLVCLKKMFIVFLRVFDLFVWLC
ncbi:MAG: hypothetical protein SPJ55_11735 [Treponema sp.]|nr:hypothetical protein [Treponema sp.]